MARVEKEIDVALPVRTVYNQWTQFEDFPHFMEGVKEVRQLDDAHLHWHAEIAGKDHEWTAEIKEQRPDERIIWHSEQDVVTAGQVSFLPLGGDSTRVHLELSYEPEGALEGMGDKLGFMDRQVQGDLERFKEFIEQRGAETGGWRGEIHNPDAPGGHTRGAAA